jgi:DNA-binding NarL/FixJ family response regulator
MRKTTREAAAAVFLSPKTVGYHLRHIYRKLGIRSASVGVELNTPARPPRRPPRPAVVESRAMRSRDAQDRAA